ncbi:hypothetical protein Tco_1427862 [Tanacetum coccineum]
MCLSESGCNADANEVRVLSSKMKVTKVIVELENGSQNIDRFSLSRELDLYYEIVIHDTEFMKLTGIAELATLMVT